MQQQRRSNVAILIGLMVGVIAAGAATIALASSRSAETNLSRGTIPERAFRADGSLDASLVPDLVAVENDHGSVVGYARRDDVASPDAAPATIVAVWDESGEHLLGHVYPDGTGFLSVAEEKARGVSPENPPEPAHPATTVVG